MEEQDVRTRSEALCAALVAGDIERVIEELSQELRHNLGEVLALLPLPSSEVTVESIERGGGSGFTVVLRLVGETETVQLQTRWKERDGRPTIIEASHLSKTATASRSGETEGEAAPSGDETA
ncbi:MAG TPA: hypothetical protein VF323_07670 [Candidatus Limnocylindrales bacterium]